MNAAPQPESSSAFRRIAYTKPPPNNNRVITAPRPPKLLITEKMRSAAGAGRFTKPRGDDDVEHASAASCRQVPL